MSLLAVEKLEVTYQRAITAVQGITLAVEPLQIVALMLAPLVVVQPALAAGLLVLMLLSERLLGEHAGRYEHLAVWAIVVGLPPDERLTYQIHIPRPSNGPATAAGTGRQAQAPARTKRRIRAEKRTVNSAKLGGAGPMRDPRTTACRLLFARIWRAARAVVLP